jgi:hypothetical protein
MRVRERLRVRISPFTKHVKLMRLTGAKMHMTTARRRPPIKSSPCTCPASQGIDLDSGCAGFPGPSTSTTPPTSRCSATLRSGWFMAEIHPPSARMSPTKRGWRQSPIRKPTARWSPPIKSSPCTCATSLGINLDSGCAGFPGPSTSTTTPTSRRSATLRSRWFTAEIHPPSARMSPAKRGWRQSLNTWRNVNSS